MSRQTVTEHCVCHVLGREGCSQHSYAALDAAVWRADQRAQRLERLYDVTRLMRATVDHVHSEPWPCPVIFVDNALAELDRDYGDREYPAALREILIRRAALPPIAEPQP